jgi:hypothetical protein
LIAGLRPSDEAASLIFEQSLLNGTASERFLALHLLRTQEQVAEPVLDVVRSLSRSEDPALRIDSLGVLVRFVGPADSYVDEIIAVANAAPDTWFVRAAAAIVPAMTYSDAAIEFVVDHLADGTRLPSMDRCSPADRVCWVAFRLAVDSGGQVREVLWHRWGAQQHAAPLAVRLCGAVLDAARWDRTATLLDALQSESNAAVGVACDAVTPHENNPEAISTALVGLLEASDCNTRQAAWALARMGTSAQVAVRRILEVDPIRVGLRPLLLAIGDCGQPRDWAPVLEDLLRRCAGTELSLLVREVLGKLDARKSN